jgi:hypothetical protein
MPDGELIQRQGRQVRSPTGVLDVDAHQRSRCVIVQNHALGDFVRIDGSPFTEVDVEGIRCVIVIEFLGLNLRSGKALW